MAKNPLTKKFFIKNRTELQKSTGDIPIIITANSPLQRSADAMYPFSQEANFWYLTGINEPNITAVFFRDESFLILPKHDSVRSVFDGEIDISSLSAASGITAVYEYEEGWKTLGRIVCRSKRFASLQPATPYIESLGMFTNPSRARLIEKIKEIKPDIELVDLRQTLARMRSIKSNEEIACIKSAISETIELFAVLEKIWKDAKNENDLFAAMRTFIANRRLDFAYDPIAASGKNALTLHYHANSMPFDRSSGLLIDAGLRVNHYNADLTRTVIAKPTKRQRDVYQAVVSVHDYAISLLKPGITIKEYEKSVSAFMGKKLIELGLIQNNESSEVRRFFPHATSHFLGIDVHDVGDYVAPIEAGMVLTVEPGIYIKDEALGIRLENNVLITSGGCENLSAALPLNISSFTIKANAS